MASCSLESSHIRFYLCHSDTVGVNHPDAVLEANISHVCLSGHAHCHSNSDCGIFLGYWSRITSDSMGNGLIQSNRPIAPVFFELKCIAGCFRNMLPTCYRGHYEPGNKSN